MATLPTTHDRRNIRIWDGRDRNPHSSARRRRRGDEEDDEEEDRDSDESSEDWDDEEDSDGEERSLNFRAPIIPHGVIWTRQIRLPGDPSGNVSCPRMSHIEGFIAIQPEHYRGIFGLNLSQVTAITGRSMQGRKDVLIRRLARPREVLGLPPPPQPGITSASVTLPDIVAEGFLPDVDQGDDLEQNEEEPSTGEVYTAGLEADIGILLNAFCSQSLQVIPVPKKQSSIPYYHTCRDPNDSYLPSITQFLEPDLQKSGFTHFQSREPHQDDWDDRFEYIFPPKHKFVRRNRFGRPVKPTSGKHWDFDTPGGYPLCSFHSHWQDAMSRCTDAGAEALRSRVKSQFFDNLVWVPWADKQRLWTTSVGAQFPIQIPKASIKGEGAPRICINPRKRHDIMWGGSLLFLNRPATFSILSSR